MAGLSSIEWTDATWNPVRGCTRVSEGCRNCYAEIMAARFSDPGQWGEGFATIVRLPKGELDHRWTGKVALIEDALDWPLRWRGSKQAHAERRPSRIFVNSTADLFHDSLPDETIDKVFAVMALAPQHVFQVLTKRPERMRAYFRDRQTSNRVGDAMAAISDAADRHGIRHDHPGWCFDPAGVDWEPLSNVWLGVSAEDQATWDERTAHLIATPAALRFVSVEPMLGPVVARGTLMQGADPGRCLRCRRTHGFSRCPNTGGIARRRADNGPRDRGCGCFVRAEAPIAWVICGGESGHGARPMDPAWARRLRDDCEAAAVPFFFKQWGEWLGAGQDGAAIGDDVWINCSDAPIRTGKKVAGARLDGREHRWMPAQGDTGAYDYEPAQEAT